MQFYRFKAIVSSSRSRGLTSRALIPLAWLLYFCIQTAIQKSDWKVTLSDNFIWRTTFIPAYGIFSLKIIRVTLFLTRLKFYPSLLQYSVSEIRTRDTPICFMINNITTFVQKKTYVQVFSFVIHQFNFEPRYVNFTYERAYICIKSIFWREV